MSSRATQKAGCLAIGVILSSLVVAVSCAKRETPEAEGVAGTLSESAAPQETRAATNANAAKLSSLGYVAPGGGAAQPNAPAPAAPRPSPRKLIKTIEMAIEVRRPEEVSATLQKLAETLGGYVSGVGASRLPDGAMQVAVTLRIPVEKLDAARAEVKKLAVKVLSEQLRTEDVTDQLVDLDARLKTLRATEVELQALLAESRAKARKVDEIMAIYTELTEIRTQIEQIGAQVVGLDRQVAYSTLQVQISPVSAARPVTGDGWQPGDRVRDSARTLVNFLRGLGDFLIFALIVGLPVLLVIWLALFLLRKLWRRVRGNRRPKAAPPKPRDPGTAAP
ncbi:MAG TPA: DUF4349 domain-containing protein [Thermoanaerobaculia bacterium]|jgi:hypothetical protein|nr:DUF4349 domain-containing protein [Thermoanaerobaculia bacterium]